MRSAGKRAREKRREANMSKGGGEQMNREEKRRADSEPVLRKASRAQWQRTRVGQSAVRSGRALTSVRSSCSSLSLSPNATLPEKHTLRAVSSLSFSLIDPLKPSLLVKLVSTATGFAADAASQRTCAGPPFKQHHMRLFPHLTPPSDPTPHIATA